VAGRITPEAGDVISSNELARIPPVMGRLLFWACIALIGLAMLALYRGWWAVRHLIDVLSAGGAGRGSRRRGVANDNRSGEPISAKSARTDLGMYDRSVPCVFSSAGRPGAAQPARQSGNLYAVMKQVGVSDSWDPAQADRAAMLIRALQRQTDPLFRQAGIDLHGV
jgi:hypothetical protein